MEAMIQRGMPQRTAHHLVGQLVGIAQRNQIRLVDLTDEQLRQAHPELDGSIREVLGVEKAVHAYHSYGSSQPERVREQILRWRKQLQ